MKSKSNNYLVTVMEYQVNRGNSGNQFMTIIARDESDNSVLKFIAFEDRLPSATLVVKQGAKLRIAGGKEYQGSVTVNWIEDAKKFKSAPSWILDNYGSYEKRAEYFKKHEDQLFKDGFVKVSRLDENGLELTDFLKLKNCLQTAQGHYVSKVEYCMNVLGALYVEGKIREVFRDVGEVSRAVRAKQGFKKYYEVLDELVEEALLQ